jgi:hypothetical protein
MVLRSSTSNINRKVRFIKQDGRGVAMPAAVDAEVSRGRKV